MTDNLLKIIDSSNRKDYHLEGVCQIVKELSEIGVLKNYYGPNKKPDMGSDKVLYVIEEKRKILSFLFMTPGHITLIATSPKHQGKGYGKLLIKKAQERYCQITTKVDALKPESIIALLTSCGFTKNQRGSRWTWAR